VGIATGTVRGKSGRWGDIGKKKDTNLLGKVRRGHEPSKKKSLGFTSLSRYKSYLRVWGGGSRRK